MYISFHSPFVIFPSNTMLLLTILLSTMISPIFTGDFPLTGIVLMQSQPPYPTFGTIRITQQVEGNTRWKRFSIGILHWSFFLSRWIIENRRFRYQCFTK